MRQLYPTNNNPIKIAESVNTKPITQAQWEELLNKVASFAEELDLQETVVENLKKELTTAWTTGQLNANNIDAITASIDTLTTKSLESTNLNATEIASQIIRSSYISGDRGDVDVINSKNINTDEIKAKTADFDVINVNSSLNTDEINTTDATFETATINKSTIAELGAESAVVEDAQIQKATIEESEIDNLQSTDIVSETIETVELKSAKSDLEYITHLDYFQNIIDQDDYYIVLPKFTNGQYYIEGRSDGNEKLFAIEVFNSESNLQIRWSKTEPAYILDWDIITDEIDGVSFVQIHGKTNSKAIKLYHQSQSLDNTNPPDIYDVKQYEGKTFDVSTLSGTYIPNPTFAGQFYVDELFIDTSIFENLYISNTLYTPTKRDVEGQPISWGSGEEGDYLTIDENNQLTWKKPADKIVEEGLLLTNQNTIYNYDGTAEDIDGETKYPIKNLGDSSIVHGSITAEENITADESFNSPTINDSNEGVLTTNGLTNVQVDEDGNTSITDWSRATEEDGKQRLDRLAVYNKDGPLSDNKPVVYNEDKDALQTTESISIDDLTVDKLTANKAYVQELHAVQEQQEIATSDYLTLRANNESALTTEQHSGILVNNYDGEHVAGIIADSDGIVRVGTGSKTDTSYENIYFADDKWYTDEDLTEEVTPEGTMTAWSAIEETGDYIHYTDAVFSQVDLSDLQPVLTRSEAPSMTDESLIKWNGKATCAETISHPTSDEQVLTWNGTPTYECKCLIVFHANCDGSERYFEPIAGEYFTSTTKPDSWIQNRFVSCNCTGNGYNAFGTDCRWYFFRDQAGSCNKCWRCYNPETCSIECGGTTGNNSYPDGVDATSIDSNGWYGLVEYITDTRLSNGCYVWKDKQAGVYHFATMADYEASTINIPEDSLIVIDDETNYLKGEEQ